MSKNQTVLESQILSDKCSEIGITPQELNKMCMTMNESPNKILQLIESYEKYKKKQKDYKKKNTKKIKTSLNTYTASDLGEIDKKRSIRKNF